VVPRRDCIEIAESTTDLENLEAFVNEWKLEGIVAKHEDNLYEAGRRSGVWVKMRLDRRQEFVVGGYTPSDLGLDALLVGSYAGREFRFAVPSAQASFPVPRKPDIRARRNPSSHEASAGDCLCPILCPVAACTRLFL
jgi:hypothetical protein